MFTGGPKRNEVMVAGAKLHNMALNTLQSSLNGTMLACLSTPK